MCHSWHKNECAKVGMNSIVPQLAQTCMCHIQYNEHFGLSIYVVATVHIEPHLCTMVSLHGATLGILCPLSHSAHCVCHIWHNVHLAYYCPTFGTFHSVHCAWVGIWQAINYVPFLAPKHPRCKTSYTATCANTQHSLHHRQPLSPLATLQIHITG